MLKLLFATGLVFLVTTAAIAQQPRTEWTHFCTDSAFTNITPAGILATATGNIYLAANGNAVSSGNANVLLFEYSPSGQSLGTVSFDSPDHGIDAVNALLTSGDGNFYLPGWHQVGASSCIQIIKCTPAGDTLWMRRYTETCDLGIWIYDWASDSAGNIFCGGKIYGEQEAEHWVIAKFNSDGSFGWLRTKLAAPFEKLWASALAVDADGNLCVTGLAAGLSTASVFTCKYSPAGDELWCRNFAAFPDAAADNGRAIAVDGAGNLVVVGQTTATNAPLDFDLLVIKYTPDGDTLWTRRFGPTTGLVDFGTQVVCDGSDNIIVSGFVNLGDYGISDLTVLKFSPAGQLLWSDIYDGVTHESDEPGALQVAADGSIVLLAMIDRSDTFDTGDMLLRKYEPWGGVIWNQTYYGLGNTFELAELLAPDPTGKWLVSGWSSDGGSNYSAYLNKYSDFLCGDANNSRTLSVSDVIFLIHYIFIGGPIPNPALSGDADCNGILTISDAVYLIGFIFAGGPAPCAACP